MKCFRTTTSIMTAALLLSACAAPPMGPTVAVMPAPNKPPDVFEQDNATCRNFAEQQVAPNAQAAKNSQVGSAVVGTVLGAGLGAAIGGGRGAAIGAAGGAVAGTAYGAGPAQQAQYSMQQQYNIAYEQCMYSRGNQVPGYRVAPSYPSYPPPPPPSGTVNPVPPGY
jgi:uncharacterized protein YcfJ